MVSHWLAPLLLLVVGCHRARETTSARVFTRQGPHAQGSVLVAYDLGCERGCDRIERGDRLVAIDRRRVRTPQAVDAASLTDGKPHRLEVWKRDANRREIVTIVARPHQLAPLRDVGPFWTVSAAALDAAPDWARRRMFAHASPRVQLITIDGDVIDGRQLYGRRRLLVYWDWGDRVEEAHAVVFMQVLQKAQADLAAKAIDILFVHASFPGTRKQPMNAGELRRWSKRWGLTVEGRPLPAIPLHRFPDETERDAARELGMEHDFTVRENLGQSPALVLIDERGIVRWHSEGIQEPPPDAAVRAPDQYTIIEAVKFALDEL